MGSENINFEDSRAIFNVIGCLLKDQTILLQNNFLIAKEDFPENFHRIIFATIEYLYKKDAKKIDIIDIDNFLSKYTQQYKIFTENKGIEWLENAIDLANIETFDYNCTRVKKFTLLRKLQDDGFNIKEIYDEDNEGKLQQFDQMDIEEIVNHYTKKLISIESEYLQVKEGTHISHGIDDLITELESKPIMGFDCGINALNYYWFGLRKKYYLISANTGLGKTRIQAYFSLYLGYYLQIPNVFISTELPIDEIQTMLLSCLSGISERKIIMNQLTFEEKKKRDEAKDKLKDSKIDIVYCPDFTLEKIENIIKKYILNKKVEYIFFDYIKESISMLEGINKRVGKTDGWKALNLFSERLKMMVEKYNVGIMSATQLNKEGDTSGSGAIPNAVDIWAKLRIASEKEIEKYNLAFEKLHEDEEIMVLETKKNRKGMNDFNVFLLTNLGKLYYKEILVTKGGNIIKVSQITMNTKVRD